MVHIIAFEHSICCNSNLLGVVRENIHIPMLWTYHAAKIRKISDNLYFFTQFITKYLKLQILQILKRFLLILKVETCDYSAKSCIHAITDTLTALFEGGQCMQVPVPSQTRK